jgi:exodeoxyribonuclease VII large subunit
MAIREMLVRAYSVGEVMRYLREIFEVDEGLQDLWVRGEVSNFMRAASGHCYFSLKDEQATLRCVLFRGNAINAPRLSNGMQIFAHGRMSVYEARGEMQLTIDQVEDAGIGVLYQRFLALKDELEAQGLFAAERKRAIPTVPAVIGIVTSRDAAALRDIVRTLRLRWPLARVVLAPTLVQGETAAPSIARAIEWLNRQGEADVIIIARGGGSIEDLWAFNEKVVAHAIAASRIPIVTGIGHETDFTIADFVADHRAATPTAAAAAVTPDITLLRAVVAEASERLQNVTLGTLDTYREIVAQHQHRLSREHPRERYERARQQVDDLVAQMQQQMDHRVAIARERLGGASMQLQALSPLLTIARGFATVTRDRDGVAVTTIADVLPPEAITVRVRDGALAATVTATQPNPPS